MKHHQTSSDSAPCTAAVVLAGLPARLQQLQVHLFVLLARRRTAPDRDVQGDRSTSSLQMSTVGRRTVHCNDSGDGVQNQNEKNSRLSVEDRKIDEGLESPHGNYHVTHHVTTAPVMMHVAQNPG